MIIDRHAMGDVIAERLHRDRGELAREFRRCGHIASVCIDNLLPEEWARQIYSAFPEEGRMRLRNSLKERKLVSAQMDMHQPILEEVVFAFQEPSVVSAIANIIGLKGLEPDHELYAGGISMMTKGHYLKPHVDNSHDMTKSKYRVLNALYYVSPGWAAHDGGSLQLWDDGPHGTPRTIPAMFNRLVLMITNRTSWHSVNEVRSDGRRCCVSNYYFSPLSPDQTDYFHATSFRDHRTGLKDAVMLADSRVKTMILRLLRRGYRPDHIYKR